jgi:two-component system, OmpR family, response regulator
VRGPSSHTFLHLNELSNVERGNVVSKILIVDDDPDIVEAGKMVLQKEGYDVASASNYTDGIAGVEQFGPDLVILDVMMEEPDDGLRLARALRRKGFDQPILMLTSVNAAMGLSIGRDDEMVPVDEFQEKPVDPVTLIDKVKRLLEK